MTQLYCLTNQVNSENVSPFVWRIILALKHKGITYNLRPLSFSEIPSEIPKLTSGKHNQVPVLITDDNLTVYESYKIAEYLEKGYPANPLFPHGKALSKFLENYFATSPLFFIIMSEILNYFHGEDQKYFRESREKMLGCSVEDFSAKKEEYKILVDQFLYPLRSTLAKSSYFEGDEVTYSDYIVYGMLKTIQQVSKLAFNDIVTNHKEQALNVWFEKIDKLI